MNEHRSFFGDIQRAFLLTPDLIIELERKTGAGIGGLSRRFFAGEFSYRELTEVIRLGLIGGGTDPEEAAALISTYAARMAVTELYAHALPIIETVMFGKTQPTPKTRKKSNA
ncbi:MAG: hypothetical protein ABS40_10120 [Agrobacterium sp. SCN 61-19]|nr:MAG: hypothetical protein ABS40_10120 [Agrobacterium sp. SCN 61-19]